jgi:hypothetical protein
MPCRHSQAALSAFGPAQRRNSQPYKQAWAGLALGATIEECRAGSNRSIAEVERDPRAA